MSDSFELIDTHAHLAFSELDSDLDSVLTRAQECDITRIVNIASGSGIEKMNRSIEIGKQHNSVYNAVGVHPNEVDIFDSEKIEITESYLNHPRTVAVGEIGLDYYRSPSNQVLQQDIFRHFLRIAVSKNFPIIIHQREAFNETINILEQEGICRKTPFVFHCFGGTEKQASKILDMGGLISVTGIVTFKKAHYLRETISRIPLDKLMLETDCPYLAPEPKRGKRNEPSFLVHIAKQVAEIKNMQLSELANATTKTATNFFKFDKK